MYKVKVLADDEPCKFEKEVQNYLSKGFRIVVANCGIIHELEGYSRTIYQAILEKEELL